MMNIFRTQKSFSARLSLWVTLAVAIVLTVTAIVTNMMVRDGILREEFVGDAQQSDDLTMLAIQYIKQQSDVKLQKAIVLPNDTQEVPRLAAFIDEVCEAVGIHLVRQIMDSINYERIDGRNVLTLRKKLNKQQNTNIKDGWLEESC